MTSTIEHTPHIEKAESMAFGVEIVKTLDELFRLEVNRVIWYREHYVTYHQQGYASLLRFPTLIVPGHKYSIGQIKEAVQQEMSYHMDKYIGFSVTFEKVYRLLTRYALPVAERLYGHAIEGKYIVAPTSYGTVAGQQSSDGPIFFRFPEFHPPTLGAAFSTGKYRTDVELLTHEILAHAVTAKLRDGTAIDESNPMCTHQKHKEYLMDLIERNILVEAGLMNAEQVAMQVIPMQTAQKDIDPLYYDASGDLSWEGNLQGLVQSIDTLLKN